MYQCAPLRPPEGVGISVPVWTIDGGDVESEAVQTLDDPHEHESDPGHEESRWEASGRRFRAFKDGDRAALEEFVRDVSPLLWQLVRSYGLDQSTAEDVVQTTWLTLIGKADQVRDDRAVLRWLTVTARREAWRTARQRVRCQPTEVTVMEPALPVTGSPETQVLDSDSQRSLWAKVGALDERCRHLLRIVAFHDRPDYASLASHLGMPLGSIGPTRSRCLAKLRTLMSSDDGSQQ